MQQFFSSINFCLRNAGYIFILCLPVMTLEIALANLIASLDIQASSDTAALEAIGEISTQVFLIVSSVSNTISSSKRRLHDSFSLSVQ